MTIFYCLRFETLPTGGQGPRIYIPQALGSLFVASYNTQVFDPASRREIYASINLFTKSTEHETEGVLRRTHKAYFLLHIYLVLQIYCCYYFILFYKELLKYRFYLKKLLAITPTFRISTISATDDKVSCTICKYVYRLSPN
jgi:hypothetical protein